MANLTPEEIVNLAQQQQQARHGEERGRSELPWRYAFIGLLGALLLGLVLWPGVPLDRKIQMTGYGICAQLHTVQMGGMTLPICARNTGIYTSFMVTSLYLLALGRGRAGKLPPLPITITLFVFIGLMAIDGFNSLFLDLFLPHLYTPNNVLRTLSGMGMGIAIAVLLFLMLNLSLRRNVDDTQPVIANWLELGGAIVINALVLLAMYGNIGWFYWPVAIVSATGILGVLFCVNLLLGALLMRYEGAVTRVAQLAKPATVALVLTVVQISALAWVRYYLESHFGLSA